MGKRLTLLLLLLCLLLGGVVYYQLKVENQPQLPARAAISDTQINHSVARQGAGEEGLSTPVIAALNDLTQTVDRPLFAADRRPVRQVDPPKASPPIPKPVVSGAPKLELTAVIINGARRLALLQGAGSGAALIHAEEGQTVQGWLLQEVLPERVVLSRDGREHELVLRKFKPPPAALLPPQNSSPTAANQSLKPAQNSAQLDLRRPRRPLRGPRLRSQQRNLQK